MRYTVEVVHSVYRSRYEVIDTTQPQELMVFAAFYELHYDGQAFKRANALAAELNAL